VAKRGETLPQLEWMEGSKGENHLGRLDTVRPWPRRPGRFLGSRHWDRYRDFSHDPHVVERRRALFLIEEGLDDDAAKVVIEVEEIPRVRSRYPRGYIMGKDRYGDCEPSSVPQIEDSAPVNGGDLGSNHGAMVAEILDKGLRVSGGRACRSLSVNQAGWNRFRPRYGWRGFELPDKASRCAFPKVAQPESIEDPEDAMFEDPFGAPIGERLQFHGPILTPVTWDTM